MPHLVYHAEPEKTMCIFGKNKLLNFYGSLDPGFGNMFSTIHYAGVIQIVHRPPTV